MKESEKEKYIDEITKRYKLYRTLHVDNCIDYLHIHMIKKYSDSSLLPVMKEIKHTVKKINVCEILPEDFFGLNVVVSQHCFGVTSHDNKYPIISTDSLNSCVGLILYEPTLKICSIAHFDGLPGYTKESVIKELGNVINYSPVHKNIGTMIDEMKKKNKAERYNFDVYMVGGIFVLSERSIVDIYQTLKSWQDKSVTFKFSGRNLLGPINSRRNISFDTRTGKIYNFDILHLEDLILSYQSKKNTYFTKQIDVFKAHPYLLFNSYA